MSSIDAIVDIDKLSNWIGLETKSSKKCLEEQLKDWTTEKDKLQYLSSKFNRFKSAIEKNPSLFDECSIIFKEISSIEEKLSTIVENKSELEKESYNEILFFRPVLQPLNFIPLILSVWSWIRIYLLPGISLILPILTLLAPYIILKFVFSIPLTFSNYFNILNSMISGTFNKIINSDKTLNISPISPFLFMKQLIIIVLTFIQGFLQPYWTFKHLKSIDNIIQHNGNLILRFKELYNKLENILRSNGFTLFKCPLPNIINERDATARVILESSYFKLALKYVGSLEVIMKLANKKEMYAVSWVKSDKPVFNITNSFDFQVPNNVRKTISVSFNENKHALLTGPNKGGKSTVLRALSISTLFAHTYGCAMGKLICSPFHKMFVCLKPDDLPGSKSRFEREIEFTASTLKYNTPILIFIDELYHSTNPNDALRSCNIYCNQLWRKKNVISVISTHLFELVEKANENIQRLCCPAIIDENGNVEFKYYLENGICKVSSVDLLLKANGLCG